MKETLPNTNNHASHHAEDHLAPIDEMSQASGPSRPDMPFLQPLCGEFTDDQELREQIIQDKNEDNHAHDAPERPSFKTLKSSKTLELVRQSLGSIASMFSGEEDHDDGVETDVTDTEDIPKKRKQSLTQKLRKAFSMKSENKTREFDGPLPDDLSAGTIPVKYAFSMPGLYQPWDEEATTTPRARGSLIFDPTFEPIIEEEESKKLKNKTKSTRRWNRGGSLGNLMGNSHFQECKAAKKEHYNHLKSMLVNLDPCDMRPDVYFVKDDHDPNSKVQCAALMKLSNSGLGKKMGLGWGYSVTVRYVIANNYVVDKTFSDPRKLHLSREDAFEYRDEKTAKKQCINTEVEIVPEATPETVHIPTELIKEAGPRRSLGLPMSWSNWSQMSKAWTTRTDSPERYAVDEHTIRARRASAPSSFLHPYSHSIEERTYMWHEHLQFNAVLLERLNSVEELDEFHSASGSVPQSHCNSRQTSHASEEQKHVSTVDAAPRMPTSHGLQRLRSPCLQSINHSLN